MLIELQRLSKPVQNRRRSSCERGNFILKSIEPGRRRRRCILFGRAISKHVCECSLDVVNGFFFQTIFFWCHSSSRLRQQNDASSPHAFGTFLSDPFQKIASSFQKTNKPFCKLWLRRFTSFPKKRSIWPSFLEEAFIHLIFRLVQQLWWH